MEVFIILLVLLTRWEVVTSRRHHRNAYAGHITASTDTRNHNSNGYGHRFTTLNTRAAYSRSKTKNKNDNAYSRSNLLGMTAKRSKNNGQGVDPEDFDHIIVVKSPKKILSSAQGVIMDKIITKEPDFDHTIVVQAKGFQTKETGKFQSVSSSSSQPNPSTKSHRLIRPMTNKIYITNKKATEDDSVFPSIATLSESTSSVERLSPGHEASINARIKPRKTFRHATSLHAPGTATKTLIKPFLSEANSTETLSPETTESKTSLGESPSPESKTFLRKTPLPKHKTYVAQTWNGSLEETHTERNRTLGETPSEEPSSPDTTYIRVNPLPESKTSIRENPSPESKTFLHKTPLPKHKTYVAETWNGSLEETHTERNTTLGETPSEEPSSLETTYIRETPSTESKTSLHEPPSLASKTSLRDSPFTEYNTSLDEASPTERNTTLGEPPSEDPSSLETTLPKSSLLKSSLNVLKSQNKSVPVQPDSLEHISETSDISSPSSNTSEASEPETSLQENFASEAPSHEISPLENSPPESSASESSSPESPLSDKLSPGIILDQMPSQESPAYKDVHIKPHKKVRRPPGTFSSEPTLPESTLSIESLPEISLPETKSPESTLPKTSLTGIALSEKSYHHMPLRKEPPNKTSFHMHVKPNKLRRPETSAQITESDATSLPAPSPDETSSRESSLLKSSTKAVSFPDTPFPESLFNTSLPLTIPLLQQSSPDTLLESSFSGSASPEAPLSSTSLSEPSFPTTIVPEALLTGSTSPSTSLPEPPSPGLLLPTGTTLAKTVLQDPFFTETNPPGNSLPETPLPGISATFSNAGNALVAPFMGAESIHKPSNVLLGDNAVDSPLCTGTGPCVPRSIKNEKTEKSDDQKIQQDDSSKAGSVPKVGLAKVRLDDISKGAGDIAGFALVSKLGCKAKFKHKGGGTQISLKRVFDDLFGEGKVPVESSSRKFINADSFHFANDIGMITVCNCGANGVLKVENLIAITSVVPVKWLELRHVRVRHLEFFYEEMLEQKEGTAWNRMSISGYGLSYLGPTKQEALIQFEKVISDAKKKAIDSDMSITIQFSNDEYKDTIHVSVFLGVFGQAISSLYPEPPLMEISRLGLESLSFNRKAPKTHMIKGTISEANQYAIYVSGDVTGSNLLSTAKDVYIICQNDFSIIVNNVNCALVATLDVALFDFNSVLNDMELTVIAEEVKLFRGGKIPETVFFQSSKATFDTINVAEIRNEVTSIARNEKKRDKASGAQAMIIAGTCFRYRLPNIGDQFPNIPNTNDTDVLVNMCPGIDNVKFYLPDLGPIALSQIPTLVSDADTEISKFQKLFGNEQMEVDYLEVSKSDIGGGFKFVTQITPRVFNHTGGFHFLSQLSFLEITQNSMQIVREKNKQIQLEGSGEETMLKSISTFTLGRKESEMTISGEMKIRSREVLLESLKEWTKKDEKEETNTPFIGLQSLTLRSLRYTATAGVDRVMFSGSALLGDNPDATFQMVVYTYKSTTEVATCVYRENADVADFVNAIYGKTLFTEGWLKVENIGVLMQPGSGTLPEISRFPREFCNIDYYTKRGGTDKVTLLLNDFRLDDCERNGKPSESCLFLKRVFRDKVPVKMVGAVRSGGLHLEGYTSREMTLGPNLVLRGTRYHRNEVKNEKIHIKMIVSENINEITFEGSLKFGGDTSKELPGKIILAGDNLMLEIPESTATDYLDIIRNDKLEFVQLVGTASGKRSISTTEEVTMLVVNSAMKIGNSGAENAISFTDRNLIKQYIDPETMEVKMYACKSSNTSMEVNEVLKAFGEGKANVRGLLDKSKLKGLCITYHEGNDKWKIEDLGLEVESGLRITAALESRFGSEGGKTSSINAEIRIDDGKSVLCVLLPPQMWAVKERIISSKGSRTRVKVPRMEMYFKDDSRSFGPELCYEVPFVGERAFGYLTGYMKTVGLETDGEITISALNTPGNMYNYMFEYSGPLFSQVEGSLRLDAVYPGQDLSEAKFKVRFDVLEYTQKVLKERVLKFTQDRSMKAIRHLSKAREYLANFTRWKKQYDDERIVLLTEHQRNKNQFRRRKIERARSMQAVSKDCSHDCGYVRVPGWSVDERCAKNRNGRYLRCMNYVKDGHVASNVGCVASCESDRVRSLVEAKELNEAAMRDGRQVDKTQECLDLLQDAVQLINIYVEKMTDSVIEMEKVTKSHRDLAFFNVDNIEDKIQIERLDAEVFIDELEDPSCIPFTIHAKVTFDENNDVVKSYTKIKRCFNGMFVKKLVEFIFEDMMKSDIEAMEKYIETMDERYASFESILKRTSKSSTSRKIKIVEESFKQCHSSDVMLASNVRRRSVVESTLSPLTPSVFTIFRDSTVKAFKHNSPWSISKRRDVFGQFIRTQRIPVMHNVTHSENGEQSCSAARRAAVDYADIANYAYKWIKEQSAAKRTLSSVQKYIIDDVKKADLRLNSTKYRKDEIDNMQYWMSKAKEGMSQWLESESSRIERHNREGLPVMKKELELAYTDRTHKNLRDFLTHRSSDGSKALKKANIETPSSSIFLDLSKNLLNVLESGKSLQEISSPVEEIIRRIDGLEKRTILCNA